MSVFDEHRAAGVEASKARSEYYRLTKPLEKQIADCKNKIGEIKKSVLLDKCYAEEQSLKACREAICHYRGLLLKHSKFLTSGQKYALEIANFWNWNGEDFIDCEHTDWDCDSHTCDTYEYRLSTQDAFADNPLELIEAQNEEFLKMEEVKRAQKEIDNKKEAEEKRLLRIAKLEEELLDLKDNLLN